MRSASNFVTSKQNVHKRLEISAGSLTRSASMENDTTPSTSPDSSKKKAPNKGHRERKSSLSPAQSESMCIQNVLPGFGLPVDYNSYSKVIPNALFSGSADSEWRMVPLTLRERKMLSFMNTITDKPEWERKIFDEKIVGNWKRESLKPDFTELMFNWCMEELKQFVYPLFKETQVVVAFDGGICKSDSLIPEELRQQLVLAISRIKSDDWHPDSDEQVLDVVHPSLYPVVSGRTRALKKGMLIKEDCIARSMEGETVEFKLMDERDKKPNKNHWYASSKLDSEGNRWSLRFQWLPCDVEIQSTDRSVRIPSYINNIHPQHNADLYLVIEKVLQKIIPMWNVTLREYAKLRQLSFGARRILTGESISSVYPDGWEEEEHEHEENDAARIRFELSEPGATYESWEERCKKDGNSDAAKQDDINIDLFKAFSKLQVVVKFAEIHLTPERPKYKGGSWHVEGQANEHIVATAVYYYEFENIGSTYLDFRAQVDGEILCTEEMYSQSHHAHIEAAYGFQNYSSAVLDCGSAVCREGRVVTFANIFQHYVRPFKLIDKTKPGHRKIMALFLVDPNVRVLSSSVVPPQQVDWWWEHLMNQKEPIHRLSDVPREMQDLIRQEIRGDSPYSLEEAKEIRLELMKERKKFIEKQTEDFEAAEFALCEH